MKKKNILIWLGVFTAVFAFLSVVSAGQCSCCGKDSCQKHEETCSDVPYDEITGASPVAKTVDVGNKICPVMGAPIHEESKVTLEYEGKIYNFCCPGCIPEFKKDPEKYIKKIEEEMSSKK